MPSPRYAATMDSDYLPSPEIRFYIRLKNFFRKFETDTSHRRLDFVRRAVEHLYSHGYLTGFDVLGSINFGMSQSSSDLDLVVYYEEPHLDTPAEKLTAQKIQQLVVDYHEEYCRRVEKFKLHFVDHINLNRVEISIRTENPYCFELQSFLLYRTICRGVHYRVLRENEQLLIERPHLMMYLEEATQESFRELISNPTSRYSFVKYKERLESQGKSIPADIQTMLDFYFEGKLDEQAV